MKEVQKERKSPRVSVNALATYMGAKPAKRESVLREQKFPATFRARWYDEATKIITRCLVDRRRDQEVVVQAIDRLHAFTSSDKNKRLVAANNASALEGFLTVLPDLESDGLVARRFPEAKAGLDVEGVLLSVRPEILLEGTFRGSSVRGGIKLYLNKTTALGQDGGEMIGTLLHEYTRRACSEGVACKQRHCQVIDAFGEACYTAPAAIKRRMRDVEAACREIRERWPHIKAK